MNILFLSHYFPPEGNAPASRTFENCKHWAQAGHTVTVITCAPNSPQGKVYEGYKNRIASSEVVEGIRVLRVWSFLAANKGTLRRILNFLSYMVTATVRAMFISRPDVVIATSPQFFCGWAGVLVAKLRRRPLILEIRDLWPDTITAIGAMDGGPLIRVLEILEQGMYRASTAIVTVGEGYEEELLSKGVPKAKISIITNGADLKFFLPRAPSAELLEKYGLRQKFVCSSIGTIGMCHGMEIVPLAAKILQDRGRGDIVFLFVGDGARKVHLETQSLEMGLRNIVFAGRQEKQTMPDFLSISGVCLAHLQRKPLFKTVLPSKIFEAMAMAKPIILGVEGQAALVLDRAQAGICIEPENAKELADAVERMADDSHFRETLGSSGHAFVKKYFDREVLAREYLEIVLKHS